MGEYTEETLKKSGREEALSGTTVLGVSCTGGDNLRVENHRFEILFSGKTGQILELNDKASGKTVMKARKNESIFSYRYDKYGYDDINEYLRQYGYHFTAWGIQDYGREGYPFCEHETFFPSFVKYEIEGRAVSFFYCARESADQYGDAGQIKLTVTFPEEGDKLYVSLSLIKKQESPYVEAGSLIFPFAERRVRGIYKKEERCWIRRRTLKKGLITACTVWKAG